MLFRSADVAAHAGPSEIAVDELSDEEMLDEDAMPRQKVEIDNKVCSQLSLTNRATHPGVFK